MTSTQTEPFIPLSNAAVKAGERQEFSVTVVTQAERVQMFKPLETEAANDASAPGTHHGKTCDPRVSIQRDGDVVTGLRIVCGCGQVIDLACLYQEPNK